MKHVSCFLISLVFICFLSCSDTQDTTADIPLIVATTGMIGDAIEQLVGEKMEVISLMGPGVDPHLYKATPRDLQYLRKADLVCYNGLYLEGKMGEVLVKLARQKPVYAVAEVIPKENLLAFQDVAYSHDPHIWFDVSLWQKAVEVLSQELMRNFPEQEAMILQNMESYRDSLAMLHDWVKAEIQQIPSDRRVLITAHDAFGYFGRAYAIEVKGLQGISTVSEFGLKDIRDLVEYIVSKKIKAVFVESSIPRRSLEAVVSGCKEKGHNVTIGGTLYSDAMGAEDTPAGEYLGMVRENVRQIVRALK